VYDSDFPFNNPGNYWTMERCREIERVAQQEMIEGEKGKPFPPFIADRLEFQDNPDLKDSPAAWDAETFTDEVAITESIYCSTFHLGFRFVFLCFIEVVFTGE